MVNNRSRGRRGEIEYAKFIGGQRISRTGESGSDVKDGKGRTWEVKRIKTLPKRISAWLIQASYQSDFGVAFREDRGKWYVIIEAKKFLEYYED